MLLKDSYVDVAYICKLSPTYWHQIYILFLKLHSYKPVAIIWVNRHYKYLIWFCCTIINKDIKVTVKSCRTYCCILMISVGKFWLIFILAYRIEFTSIILLVVIVTYAICIQSKKRSKVVLINCKLLERCSGT